MNGVERRIAGTGEGVVPTVSGSRLAYARFRPDGTPRVIVRRLGRGEPPLRVFGGPSSSEPAAGPVSLDLFADRLAVTWQVNRGGDGSGSLLFVTGTAGSRRTRVRVVPGGGNMTGRAIVGAGWSGGPSLRWAEICGGDPSGCPGRTFYGQWSPGEALRTTRAPRTLLAFAATDRAAWTLGGCLAPGFGPGGPACTLLERTPPPLASPST